MSLAKVPKEDGDRSICHMGKAVRAGTLQLGAKKAQGDLINARKYLTGGGGRNKEKLVSSMWCPVKGKRRWIQTNIQEITFKHTFLFFWRVVKR